MKYRKYNEIENCKRTKFVEKLYEQGKDAGTWVVTEKVHGSNVSIQYDGKNFYCGKRSDWITDEDHGFYNYAQVLENHKTRIEGLYEHMKDELKLDFDVMTLYGELCGGNYPHPEVKPVKGSIRVQKGIHYSPHNEFYVFDMMLDDEYVNYDVVEEALAEYSFLYAHILWAGTLEECLQYSNEFQTGIPTQLGLPPIENNLCEGVVVKPNVASFMGHSRVILKNKNAKWSENTKKRKAVEPVKMSNEAKEMLEEVFTYITENRLKNVLSKEGQINNKMFGYIMKKFTEDIWTDFNKDHDTAFNELDAKEMKIISKRVGLEASSMLRENFLNIIDGMF